MTSPDRGTSVIRLLPPTVHFMLQVLRASQVLRPARTCKVPIHKWRQLATTETALEAATQNNSRLRFDAVPDVLTPLPPALTDNLSEDENDLHIHR